MIKSLRSFALLAALAATTTFAQWVPYNHPGYSNIYSITSSPGALYMVAYGTGGVVKSVDNGGSWNPANSGLPGTSAVESVFYNGSALFSGTHSGVYRSDNSGGTWSLTNTGLPLSSATNCAKKFFRYSTTTFALYSATIGNNGGIWRTTDNGANWYSGNAGLSANMNVYQIAEINGILYAATSVGLYYSNTLGVGWSPVTTPASNFACYAVQGSGNRIVIISTFGYRYSVNNGAWQTGAGAPTSPTGGELIQYDGKFWAITGSSPADVLRSTNGGANWSVYETGLTGADVIAQYTFHASGTTLYLGALSKLYGHPGTTTGEEEIAQDEVLPTPYPTVFDDAFSVDLSAQQAGRTLLLLDASGREVAQRNRLPQGVVRFERDGLPSGTYRVLLVDPITGQRRVIGSVIAQ